MLVWANMTRVVVDKIFTYAYVWFNYFGEKQCLRMNYAYQNMVD